MRASLAARERVVQLRGGCIQGRCDVSVDWVPKEEIEKEEKLAQGYKNAVTAPRTRTFHAF